MLIVYDALGREIRSFVGGILEPGEHGFTFEGDGLAGGMVHVRLRFEAKPIVESVMLLK